MAKINRTDPDTAATGADGAVAVAPVPLLRTPDNTPPPGGGRWRWDEALANWVDQDAQRETVLNP